MHSKVLYSAVTFDDVLLLPMRSSVMPQDVDLTSKITSDVSIDIPIISAAMDTVTESKMAIAMARLGGLGVVHKNMTKEAQADEIKKVKACVINKDKALKVGAAIGTSLDCKARLKLLYEAGADLVVIDTAHGHSRRVIEMLHFVRNTYKDLQVIVGNIATKEAAVDLANEGAHAVKVGIGAGSICTTRIISGVGMPQITAIESVASALKNYDVGIIADGGMRYSGDIAKAIGAGAHAVMLGGILGKSSDAPGEIIEKNGILYKAYRGMGSISAMKAGSGDRYFQDEKNDAKKLVSEGVEGLVKLDGDVSNIIYQIIGGLRSSMGYVGAANIGEMREKARFVKITKSGITESHVHSMEEIKSEPNYR
ncbi:MAG: IMP dehydrogenase [Proteobacteria bacterium]|nr:IMP dehydrogenase [Pseudomonadota bacterium]